MSLMNYGQPPTPNHLGGDNRTHHRPHHATCVSVAIPLLSAALVVALVALLVVVVSDRKAMSMIPWAGSDGRYHKTRPSDSYLLNPGDPGFDQQEANAVATYDDPENGQVTYPDRPWTTFTHPTPGMSIDMAEESSCTLGFIGSQGAGYAGMTSPGSDVGLTAGHCSIDGDYSVVHWSTNTSGNPDLTLGVFGAAEHEDVDRGGDVDGDTDFSEIAIPPQLEPSHLVANRYRVTQVWGPDNLQEGMQVCKYGFRTGETCGPVISWNSTYVRINLFSLIGDSGSPAYVKLRDGTVAALGLLSGSPFDHDEVNDYVTDFALVKPVIDAMGIDLVTPAGAVQDNRQILPKTPAVGR